MCSRSLMLLLAVLPVLTGGRGAGGGPAFARRQRTALLARLGDTVDLSCRVLRLADRAVSWVRSSDLQILTHAGAVFTADARVSCVESASTALTADELKLPADVLDSSQLEELEEPEELEPGGSVHTLRIARLRLSDSGRYECQINTEPKMSLFFNLTVVESVLSRVVVWAEGGGRAEGRAGGAARLACGARYEPPSNLSTLPPLRISWTHEGRDLDPKSMGEAGAVVSLETERWAGGARSRLTLAPLSARLAGRYACRAAPASPASPAALTPAAPAAASAALALRVLPRAGAADADYGDVDESPTGEMQRDQAVARTSGAARGARGAGGARGGRGVGGARGAGLAGGAALALLVLSFVYT